MVTLKHFVKLVCCFLIFSYCKNGISQITKGKDFWFGFMYSKPGPGPQTVPLEVYVSSERIVSGTVSIPGLTTQVFNVTPNSTAFINIPSPEAMADNFSDVIESKAIHITTCDSVSVYAINKGDAASDATIIYPTHVLGNDYRILTMQGNPTDEGKEFLIVATENNSRIEIVPSVSTNGSHPAGISYTITLHKGQMYQVTADNDLTGTTVKSAGSNCSNFTVFSGHKCLDIGGCGDCDHLYEQLLPTKFWGKQFVIGKFAQKKHLIFRVLANTNGTSFTIDGGSAITLNAGQFYEYSSSTSVGPSYISSDKPVMLMQYMAGHECDGNFMGDPDEVLIYPVEQTTNMAIFYTISSFLLRTSYANISTKTSAVASIKLNGINIAGSFTPVPSNPLYSYATGIPLNQNTNYKLVSDSGFYAFVYGMGEADSYIYPVGSSVRDPVADFTITVPATLCPGETWGFHAINDPGATYSWNYGDGSTGSGSSSLHSYTTEGTYSVTLTKAAPNSCPVEIVKWVTVKKLSVKIRNKSGLGGSVCQKPTVLWTNIKNDTILLKVPTLCGDTIRQTFVNHLDSVRWSTGSRDSSITVNPSVTTKYFLYGYAQGSTCMAIDSIVITVANSYTTSIVTTLASCLALGSATASIAGGTAPFSYTWTGSVSSSSVAVDLSAGHHTLTIADAGGCLQTHSFTISGSGSVTLAISGNTNICSGGSASLTASGALTYSWSGSVSSTSLAIVSPTTNTTYTVIGTDAAGCSGSQTVTVIVGGSIPITISGNMNICSGGSASLTASGATSYTWSGGVSSASLAIVSPTTNTTYTVIGVDAAGCSGSQTVTVIVGGSIPIAISGNTNICSGGSASLTASGALTYTWSGGISSTSLAIVSLTTTTTYTVIGTDAAGCSGSQTVTVMVNAPPTLSINGTATICEGASTTLTVSGAVSYTWSTGNPTATLTVNPLVTATYSVRGTDVKGCSGVQVMTVSVNPLPLVSATGNTLTCLSPSVTLAAVSSGSYSWAGPGIVAGGNTANPLVNKPGSYSLTVTYANGCFNVKTVQVVDQLVDVQAGFTTNPEKGPAPLSVSFTNFSTNALVFQWMFGDGTISTAVNPQHVFDDEGSYMVYLIAGNGLCADTATVNINVEPEFVFYVPNSFSPNQDGVNDLFTGKGIGVSKFELWVFDRWGTNIFYSNDIQKGWDGSVKGKEVKQDVYSWKINLTDVNAKKHSYVGHVTLLK